MKWGGRSTTVDALTLGERGYRNMWEKNIAFARYVILYIINTMLFRHKTNKYSFIKRILFGTYRFGTSRLRDNRKFPRPINNDCAYDDGVRWIFFTKKKKKKKKTRKKEEKKTRTVPSLRSLASRWRQPPLENDICASSPGGGRLHSR